MRIKHLVILSAMVPVVFIVSACSGPTIDYAATIAAQETRISEQEASINPTEEVEVSTPAEEPTGDVFSAELTATELPTPTQLPAMTEETDSEVCEDKVLLAPLRVQELDGAGLGFKAYQVDLAAVNRSTDFAIFSQLSNGDVHVTTEDGFVYPIGSSRIEGVIRHWPVPPGFSVLGQVRDSVGPGRQLSLNFQAAESQEHFIIAFEPTFLIFHCVNSPLRHVTNETSFEFNLDTDVKNIIFPTTREDIPSILDPIQVVDKGVIQFSEPFMDGERIILPFSFSNASEGYETGGKISGYIIGDDGIIRDSAHPGGQFQAGPALTSESQMSFVTGEAKDLKLVISIDDGPYQVYDLPDGF